MKETTLIFPIQLFEDTSLIPTKDVILIEEKRFFTDFKFNKNKLVLHRASMKFYADYLTQKRFNVKYIEFIEDWQNDLDGKIYAYDILDDVIEKKLKKIKNLEIVQSPYFINSKKDFDKLLGTKDHYSQNSFYIQMRKNLKILVDENLKPVGDKWSFDKENREKIPSSVKLPKLNKIRDNKYVEEAKTYVEKHFKSNYGDLSGFFLPTKFDELKNYVDDFFKNRFKHFGEYEDAIIKDESLLFHSGFSALLNIGFLTPQTILDKTMKAKNIEINSLEGFIRQIIGWREFMGAMYYKSASKKKSNFFKLKKPIPKGFYDGTTGIEPVDDCIKKVLSTGYNNHIERLMVLGNFMLLSEINPNAVYKWFMEMYVDSYDWVMTPNVYGMSQYADGGIFTSKPYISSSNYILKMSNYKKGDWSEVFDELFWSFLEKHREVLSRNPRMGLMINALKNRPKKL